MAGVVMLMKDLNSAEGLLNLLLQRNLWSANILFFINNHKFSILSCSALSVLSFSENCVFLFACSGTFMFYLVIVNLVTVIFIQIESLAESKMPATFILGKTPWCISGWLLVFLLTGRSSKCIFVYNHDLLLLMGIWNLVIYFVIYFKNRVLKTHLLLSAIIRFLICVFVDNYLVHHLFDIQVRDPMPAVFFFLVDVSLNAVQTGATAAACTAINQAIVDLPVSVPTFLLDSFLCNIICYYWK